MVWPTLIRKSVSTKARPPLIRYQKDDYGGDKVLVSLLTFYEHCLEHRKTALLRSHWYPLKVLEKIPASARRTARE